MRRLMMMLFLALCLGSVSFAQKGKPPEKRIDELKKELNLTDNQVQTIEDILADSHAKMEKLFDSHEKNMEAERSVMKEIMDKTDEEILKILDEKQQVKFKEIIAERTKKMQERPPMPPGGRDGNGGMPPGDGPHD
jgi:Spy/CpxP family protein refolding chaperone